MGKLDTLKVAAFVLKDLKNNERVYKQELVKVASKEIYKAKTGRPYMEKDAAPGFWGNLGDQINAFNPIAWINPWQTKLDSTDDKTKGEYDTYTSWQRAKNWWGRLAGDPNAQAVYANSNKFANQAERDAYLRRRASWQKDSTTALQSLRDAADNNLEQWTNRKLRSAARDQQAYQEANNQYIDTAHSQMQAANKSMQKRMDKMYNNPGLLGGPSGLSPHVGGPANHIPTMYGPYNTGWYAGQPIGRGYGYGYGGRPYGSVYSRGGYGGRGYGGYAGYGGGPGYGAWPRATWR